MQEFVSDQGTGASTAGEDLAALFLNEQNYLEHLLKELERIGQAPGLAEQFDKQLTAQKVKMSDLLALKVSGNVESADKIAVVLTVLAHHPDAARRMTGIFRDLAAQITAHSSQNHITKADVKQQGSNVTINVELTGLREVIAPRSKKVVNPSTGKASPESDTSAARCRPRQLPRHANGGYCPRVSRISTEFSSGSRKFALRYWATFVWMLTGSLTRTIGRFR